MQRWGKKLQVTEYGPYIIDSLENILDYKGLNNFNKKQNDYLESSVLVNVKSYIHKRVLESKISNLATICDKVQLSFFSFIYLFIYFYQIEQKDRYLVIEMAYRSLTSLQMIEY
jgi:hypothetical protein